MTEEPVPSLGLAEMQCYFTAKSGTRGLEYFNNNMQPMCYVVEAFLLHSPSSNGLIAHCCPDR